MGINVQCRLSFVPGALQDCGSREETGASGSGTCAEGLSLLHRGLLLSASLAGLSECDITTIMLFMPNVNLLFTYS